jgi:hypothetical protein
MFPIWMGPEGVIPVATRWRISPFTEAATTSAQWILSFAPPIVSSYIVLTLYSV